MTMTGKIRYKVGPLKIFDVATKTTLNTMHKNQNNSKSSGSLIVIMVLTSYSVVVTHK